MLFNIRCERHTNVTFQKPAEVHDIGWLVTMPAPSAILERCKQDDYHNRIHASLIISFPDFGTEPKNVQKTFKGPGKAPLSQLITAFTPEYTYYEVVTFRPRARYLYWKYIEATLRNVYKIDKSKEPTPRNEKALELGNREVGKTYWGSRGRYIKRNHTQGFIEVMGHEYEHLMDGAKEPEQGQEEEPDPTVVAVAKHSTVERNRAADREESVLRRGG